MVLPLSQRRVLGLCSPAVFAMVGLLAMLLLASASVAQDAAPLPEKVAFNRDVRPILVGQLFLLPRQRRGHREADLRLDIREEALASAAFIPGKPTESTLIERILADDPDERMPPPLRTRN